jgi:hypothetical protein
MAKAREQLPVSARSIVEAICYIQQEHLVPRPDLWTLDVDDRNWITVIVTAEERSTGKEFPVEVRI